MRDITIDMLKIIACLGIVLLHVMILGFDFFGGNNVSAYLYYMGTFSVPLFFMINGYFLLNKLNLSYKYLIIKIKNIVIVVFSWNIILWIMKRDFYSNPIKKIVGSLLQRGYFFQFWFFGSLIIIYLTLPYLKKLLNNKKNYLRILLLLLTVGIIIEIINLFVIVEPIQRYIPQTFRLWTWYFYYIIGAYIGSRKEFIIKLKINKYITCFFLIMLFVSPIFLYSVAKSIHHNIFAEYFYDSLFIKILSIGIFIIFLKLDFSTIKQNYKNTIYHLSALTMGVYILHTYVIKFLVKIIKIGYWYDTILVFGLTIGISLLISEIIYRIPILKNIIKI
ncbi:MULTISPECIES: acyltransferase [Gemella]|uniref:acyltransferase n=1 Tax=Gemella TaxID=1378 RepID=UPI000931AE81|nr:MULTISPECIES: acyltransferase family protein [Gemella]AXI26453.1 acetyltransferase [Gemella sp. ND 6198]